MAGKKKKKEKAKGGTPDAEKKERVVSENRRARHRFEILEQIECGIMLKGSEVKSLRAGQIALEEAYVRVSKGELWLVSADIPEYFQANVWNHEPRRPRKLLVQTRQLNKLQVRAHEKGLTLVPLKVYFNDRGLVKVLVGVGKGKKVHDKRESLKDADNKRRMDRLARRR